MTLAQPRAGLVTCLVFCFSVVNPTHSQDVVSGDPVAWQPVQIAFSGPQAAEDDVAPNPFLDYRLQVLFRGPSGVTYDVPGYFDGDGQGQDAGDQWGVKFTPDRPGRWTYQVSFRQGEDVAISASPDSGRPCWIDGRTGELEVAPTDHDAAGFLKWGRLEYVGGHYLKFREGPYWIRGGVDSPENFLAYAGFDDTIPSHRYAVHTQDWRPGDPDWNQGRGKAIIGAINDLAARRVNSLYFLTMNVGGDGRDVWPWLNGLKRGGDPNNDNLHFDISKLRQWEIVFAHAQRRGINLHFVLSEAEAANKNELDDGQLGRERKLYFRELVARFAHHNALSWNLCEEYNLEFDLGPQRVRDFADHLIAIDPYGHPVTVHSAGDPLEALRFTIGDERFSLTSIQLNQRRIDEVVERFRRATAQAGRPLPISVDEFTIDAGQKHSWKPVDDAELHRKQKIWPTLLSGGQIEFILDDLLGVESFKTPKRRALWSSLSIARSFVEDHLPFWEMSPADDLIRQAASITVGAGSGRSFSLGAQVFQKPGQVYAIYFPAATQVGQLDLRQVNGKFQSRWFSPRTGKLDDATGTLVAGDWTPLDSPQSETDQDWVLLIKREGQWNQ